jgi:hypothetical protein
MRDALNSGSELIPIAEPILDGIQTAAKKATRGVGGGALAWARHSFAKLGLDGIRR